MQDLLSQPEPDRPIKYGIDKIRQATDLPTFQKAVDLYEQGKVTKFIVLAGYCKAEVIGTQPYDVTVSLAHFDRGRIPESVLNRVKERANEINVPYQSLIKEYIRKGIGAPR